MTAGRKCREYLSFRGEVAAAFLSLKGTLSTQHCFEWERLLCEIRFPRQEGRRLLKTDLWDEGEKTECEEADQLLLSVVRMLSKMCMV